MKFASFNWKLALLNALIAACALASIGCRSC